MAIGGGLMRVGTGIVDGVTGILVVTALTVYFFTTLPRVKAKAYQLLPRSRRDEIVALVEEILLSVGRYVGGQLGLAAINAAFTFVVTGLVGSPAPALLAVIAFIGALIPVVGTVLGSTVAVLVTLTASPTAALVVAVVMITYMQIEAYILSPRVMAQAVAVPGALVIIAALAGAALGGIIGALVAVPLAAAGLLILERVVIPRQQRA
ncbi:AI-2E family transporter [Microbacterium sp. ZW T5_45]|uniref:AI-2E family transporter n=1 Tax=Microbacterium sp. ZW T5_45 TaxID=3378080 RepID=UPI003852A2D5